MPVQLPDRIGWLRGCLRSHPGLPAGCGARDIPGDPALEAFHGRAVGVGGDTAPGDVALRRQFRKGHPYLIQGNSGGRRNLKVQQLAVFLQVLINLGSVHLKSFSEGGGARSKRPMNRPAACFTGGPAGT